MPSQQLLKFRSEKKALERAKLKRFIHDKNIIREDLIVFLNKEEEKVSPHESLDDVIDRINELVGSEYFEKEIPKVLVQRVRSQQKDYLKRLEQDLHTLRAVNVDEDILRTMEDQAKTMRKLVHSDEKKKQRKTAWQDVLKRVEESKRGREVDTNQARKLMDEIEGSKIYKKIREEKRRDYSCHVLLYRAIGADNENKFKRTIKDITGMKYRQIFSGYANVTQSIAPFNNTRTYSPMNADAIYVAEHKNENFQDREVVKRRLQHLNTKKMIWKKLLSILSTDHDLEEALDRFAKYQINCIVIKDVARGDKPKHPYNPFDKKLFSCTAPRAICHRDITYKINKDAQNFADLFGIELNQYTIDNYKANSCFINLLIDTWHDSFEQTKSDGKRRFSELTYESV
jgi:hypothetical protein